MKLETPAPSWHDLVLPGPKGDPVKKAKRLSRVIRGEMLPLPDPPKLQRHGVKSVRPWQRGRLVLHVQKPVRPSGVALASPRSARGKAQRAS